MKRQASSTPPIIPLPSDTPHLHQHVFLPPMAWSASRKRAFRRGRARPHAQASRSCFPHYKCTTKLLPILHLHEEVADSQLPEASPRTTFALQSCQFGGQLPWEYYICTAKWPVLHNKHFVRDFLQKSHVKCKTSISYETCSKTCTSSLKNEGFVRDSSKTHASSLQNECSYETSSRLTRQSLQNQRFVRDFLQR